MSTKQVTQKSFNLFAIEAAKSDVRKHWASSAEILKFADLGRQTARLVHDLANPLSAALIQVENNRNKLGRTATDLSKSLSLMQKYIDSARAQLLGQDNRISFGVRNHTRQVIDALRPIALRDDIRLQVNQIPDLSLYGDPIKFQRILSNLIVNSFDSYRSCAYKKQKTVKIHISKQNHWLIMRVFDHGEGIKTSEIPSLFEQFYSTKKISSNGLGLGLNEVKQYVEEDFFGNIKVSSSIKHGTCFEVDLRIIANKNWR